VKTAKLSGENKAWQRESGDAKNGSESENENMAKAAKQSMSVCEGENRRNGHRKLNQWRSQCQ
jgi:hypothetical protein